MKVFLYSLEQPYFIISFCYIHPFYDGNGRMSRFYNIIIFFPNNLNSMIALRLSLLIKQYTKRYYELFKDTNAEYNRGDITPFITYFLKFILFAINNTTEIISDKLNEFKLLEKKIK